MSRKWQITLAVSIVGALLAVALIGAGLTFAHGPTPTAPEGYSECGGFGGFGGMWGHGSGNTMIDVAAELFGMTTEDLRAELQEGKTLLDVAQEKGFEAKDLQDAFLTARKEALQEAVDAGFITQEQADWMMQNMEQRSEWCLDSGGCSLDGGRAEGSKFGRGAWGMRGGGMMGHGWGMMGPAFR